MGVGWVFEHEGAVNQVERALESFGAELNTVYTVDCLPYVPSERVCFILEESDGL